MARVVGVGVVALAGGLVGCGGNPATPSDAGGQEDTIAAARQTPAALSVAPAVDEGASPKPSTPNAARPANGAPGAEATQVANAAPPADTARPPNAAPDAQWTIFCQPVTGSNHVAKSRQLRDQLARSSGLDGWYLIHGESESQLLYGHYRAIDVPQDTDTRRAQADLDRIKAIKDPMTGKPVFRQPMFSAINANDPTAPAEWNLLNSGGHYTLVIADYTGHPQRKQFAVDAVREARAAGLQAYYFHGEATSSVCIGAWPREAAEEAEAVANKDPHKRVVVSADRPTEAMRENLRKLDEADQAVTLAPKFNPVDPTMRQTMQRYPHYYINGEGHVTRVKDRATGKMIDVVDPSYIVVVPRQPLVRPDALVGVGQPAGGAANRDAAFQELDVTSAIYGDPAKGQESAQPAQQKQRPRELRGIGE